MNLLAAGHIFVMLLLVLRQCRLTIACIVATQKTIVNTSYQFVFGLVVLLFRFGTMAVDNRLRWVVACACLVMLLSDKAYSCPKTDPGT